MNLLVDIIYIFIIKNILNTYYDHKPYGKVWYRSEFLCPNYLVIHSKYIELINKMISFCKDNKDE